MPQKRTHAPGTHTYLLADIPLELWLRFTLRAESDKPPRSRRQALMGLMRWYVAGGSIPPPPPPKRKSGKAPMF